ncbi:MAG: glutamate synthase large subunit [Acidimicrobiia bacterium]|nr:glutamate synthase large subunit [Acidimicrobiia bacterium]
MSSTTYPLYDPASERDACGVGFIADRSLRASHRMLRYAVRCLVNLDHRGAISVDGTGDGAGLLTQVPYRLLARELEVRDIVPPSPGWLGVVVVFLPADDPGPARSLVDAALAHEGLKVLHWRTVPVDPAVLGDAARASMPRIEQVLIDAGPDVSDVDDLERRLFLARKAAERTARAGALEGFSIPSSSARTVVYKGLFTARHIEDFYRDFVDPSFETAYAIFHQRYSTNTDPSWGRAQPFRMLAHNGEINTINSNRAWMAARQVDLRSPVWNQRTPELVPLLEPGSSDSGHLDNAFEVLVRSGRSLPHVKEMLIPSAWENVADLDPAAQAFFEYHAFLSEPWDGPAAIAATDGVTLMAALDRNGLRPARWTITPETVVVASEAGVNPIEEGNATSTGQLGPGDMLVFDLESGEIRFTDAVRYSLARRRPYGEWINTQTAYVQDPFDPLPDDEVDTAALARMFGYNVEERRLVLAELAQGRLPVGSMGNDTPLAVLTDPIPRLSRFFHQMFAQVTNPPMDPIRERLVMSLRTYLGRRGSLLEETPQQAHLMELASPILSRADVDRISTSSDPAFQSAVFSAVFPVADGPDGMRAVLSDLAARVGEAVDAGASIIILSDRQIDADHAPIPILLATGAVHHHLIRTGRRLHASIVLVSGEPRDSHDLACLIACGASAVNPYMAIDEVRQLAVDGLVDEEPVLAQENYRATVEKGLLKIFSKMGICTISAYRGSELFEIIGLDDEIALKAFGFAHRRVDGIGFDQLAEAVMARHQLYLEGEEDVGGFYKHRRGGVPHITSPKVVLNLQKAVRAGDYAGWETYLAEINDREPATLRDLLRFKQVDAIPLDEVEPVEAIMRRFSTAAMSLGALSEEAHTALAEAMSAIGGLSNSGEGGEDAARFGTPRNSSIKQIASGRFGVTPAYLDSAEELQIKMAQGSKPGEGGQLPGHKVTEQIAALRHTKPGVTLISPPPHHDIYSIEDLAQLIFDLKTFKPRARVSVKLVSEPGVGTIAVGVAKAQADVLLISGSDGGTGASPLVSVKHAGSPWEIGLAETHQALVANGLRSRIAVETDGGMRTGRDVVVAALLGAERFGFGTLPLLALGCKMVRQCHENTCPVGIATQREDLRAKYTGSADQVVMLFQLLAEEIRHHLAALGARSLEEVIGRADLLEPATPDFSLADSLSSMLVDVRSRRSHPGFVEVERSAVGDALAADWTAADDAGDPSVEIAYPVTNRDRTIGTRLSGAVTARYPEGLPEGTIRVRLAGTAGQSLGAFLAPGISIRLDGTANDYVGKGQGGGTIAVVPKLREPVGPAHGAGNAVLYGATAGKLFVAGPVGQRFAVRNSGALAIVEGCSDHGCEYMTGGTAVILGSAGRNLAAGMTGGTLFIWDPDWVAVRSLADTAPFARRLVDAEREQLQALLEEHLSETGSVRAAQVLKSWDVERDNFWILEGAAGPSQDLEAGHEGVDEPESEALDSEAEAVDA